MKCPKCGQSRPLADQVCRRCKYVFDEDRFLADLTPPRAGGGKRPPTFFDSGPRRPGLAELAARPWVPPIASLIPGLGHVLQGRTWLGALYFVLVAVFGALAIRSFSGTNGQMLFGIAVSTHATCIMDTTPWAKSPSVTARMVAMGSILAGLIALYWPLVMWLSGRFVSAQQRNDDRMLWRPIQALGPDQILIMAVLFISTIAASAWLGKKLSSKES